LKHSISSFKRPFYEGTPRLLPFVFSGILPFMIFGAFWTAILSVMALMGSSVTDSSSVEVGVQAFSIVWMLALIPFFGVGLALMFGLPLYRFFLHRHIHYAITAKRVILQKGLIGRDFEFIDFDQITHAQVTVDFWDQILGGGSGSIQLALSQGTRAPTASEMAVTPYVLKHISKPYEVFRFFKTVSYDVKTDIQYPNALRPQENPGYSTHLSKFPKKDLDGE
jgi:hypothetical protein